MTDKTEKTYAHDFVRREQPNFMSRSAGTIKSGAGKLKAGTILGLIALGTVTAAAKSGGNTGTGTCTLLSAGKNAKAGVYKAVVAIGDVSYTDSNTDTITTANAATWNLYDPDGKLIDQKQYSGSGATAVFANDQIHATITDGGTDFIVGDGFDITVAAGSGKYIQPTDSAADGSGVGTAILLEEVDATDADVTGAALLVRDAQVANAMLVYDASVTTDNEKAVVNAGLFAANIQFVGTA
jgi:hypothetical protein